MAKGSQIALDHKFTLQNSTCAQGTGLPFCQLRMFCAHRLRIKVPGGYTVRVLLLDHVHLADMLKHCSPRVSAHDDAVASTASVVPRRQI